MTFQRQLIFWLGTFAAVVVLLWLLSEILLPFIAGMALAYLLDPVTNRLQRVGVSRGVAAFLIIGVVVLVFILLMLLILPILAEQLLALISNIPNYVTRLQALLADPNRPWLRPLLGNGDTTKTISDLVSQGAVWLAGFMRGLWSGGRTLISIFSLVVVTPIVAFYLICDWRRIVDTVDSWIPLPYRATVHELAHEIDLAIAG